jgi:hypothetical protein
MGTLTENQIATGKEDSQIDRPLIFPTLEAAAS